MGFGHEKPSIAAVLLRCRHNSAAKFERYKRARCELLRVACTLLLALVVLVLLLEILLLLVLEILPVHVPVYVPAHTLPTSRDLIPFPSSCTGTCTASLCTCTFLGPTKKSTSMDQRIAPTHAHGQVEHATASSASSAGGSPVPDGKDRLGYRTPSTRCRLDRGSPPFPLGPSGRLRVGVRSDRGLRGSV